MLGGQPIHPGLDPANNMRRGKNHKQGERGCLHDQDTKMHPLQPAARGQSRHHRQQQHPQDVIEDGGAQDDLGRARREYAQVAQDSRRDSYAGGNHGRAHENRLAGCVQKPLHVTESQNEWRDDSGDRHQQRLPSHPDQILWAGFEAGA